MAANPDVRAAVIAKLGGVSKQTLSTRLGRIKKQLPMSTEDALYVLAHQLGIKIDRHLDRDAMQRVQQHVGLLRNAPSMPPTTPPKSTPRGRSGTTVVVPSARLDPVPGLTSQHAKEAKRMSDVYAMLYVFENSARDVIHRVMTSALGTNWWDQVASKPIKEEIARRKSKEGVDAWHSKRGAHEIYYTDLSHLSKLVAHPKAWPTFSPLFAGRQNWFEGIVDNLNVSRRVVAHMNPLSADDIQQVEAGFKRWAAQMRDKEGELP